MAASLYIGLMSGTSLDGIDVCLASFPHGTPRLHAHTHHPFNEDLRARILAVCRGGTELAAAADLDVELADHAVTAIQTLLEANDHPQVRAVGSHGQTVFHRPHGAHPTSWQLGDPQRIAVRTRIDTIGDFRRADVAAGGQGAPLAPAFHADVFAALHETRAVVNLGGIANITLLRPRQPVMGFDTGPANILLDAWIARERGEAFDAAGAWGATGQVSDNLLADLRAHEWFQRSPPKSTGRELFDIRWLTQQLAHHDLAPEDVQATLAELTASTVADGIHLPGASVDRVLLCGGGASNQDLILRLKRHLAGIPVETTTAYGLDPQHVESMAFAWLARQRIHGQPGNCPAVTGASRALPLGAWVRV